MKLAASEGWTVMPAGAMTWPDIGQAARRIDIIVSTERLNRIIEHEPADLVAITEAGVSLKNFNEVLMQKGQWLPLILPTMEGQRSAVSSPPDSAARNSLATARRENM